MSKEQGQVPLSPDKEKLSTESQEQALRPHSSYWPFALAVGVFIALLGIMTHPIVIGVGVVLTVVAVIGWGLEVTH